MKVVYGEVWFKAFFNLCFMTVLPILPHYLNCSPAQSAGSKKILFGIVPYIQTFFPKKRKALHYLFSSLPRSFLSPGGVEWWPAFSVSLTAAKKRFKLQRELLLWRGFPLTPWWLRVSQWLQRLFASEKRDKKRPICWRSLRRHSTSADPCFSGKKVRRIPMRQRKTPGVNPGV